MDGKSGDELETDPRFPSGPWIGFFIQKNPPLGKQFMELHLTFKSGTLNGEGRDLLGDFVLAGYYNLTDGRCDWTKQYVGRHRVFYRGFNEGKGIWGTWHIPADGESVDLNGGFHIWPKGIAQPTDEYLTAEADPQPALEEKELVPAIAR